MVITNAVQAWPSWLQWSALNPVILFLQANQSHTGQIVVPIREILWVSLLLAFVRASVYFCSANDELTSTDEFESISELGCPVFQKAGEFSFP